MTTRSPTFSPTSSFGTILSRGPEGLPLHKASLDDKVLPVLSQAPFSVGDRVRDKGGFLGTVASLTPDHIVVKWDPNPSYLDTTSVPYSSQSRRLTPA